MYLDRQHKAARQIVWEQTAKSYRKYKATRLISCLGFFGNHMFCQAFLEANIFVPQPALPASSMQKS